MASFLALYRGASVATAQLIAVSADPGLVARFADELLEDRGENPHDAVAAAVEEGRRTALRLVRDEVEAER